MEGIITSTANIEHNNNIRLIPLSFHVWYTFSATKRGAVPAIGQGHPFAPPTRCDTELEAFGIRYAT